MTKGGMNTKLHALTDTCCRPIRLFITAGQVSDYAGAAALMNGLPKAEWLLADRGYDAGWFRETLGSLACPLKGEEKHRMVHAGALDIRCKTTLSH